MLHGVDETMAVIGERYAFYCKSSVVIFDNTFLLNDANDVMFTDCVL